MTLNKLPLFAVAAFAASILTAAAQDAASVIEIAKVNPAAGAKTRSMTIENGGRTSRVTLEATPAITQADVRLVSAVKQQTKVTSGPKPESRDVAALRIQLTPEGQKKYSALIQEWQGKQIGVIVDGKLVATPVLNSRTSSRELTVSGAFTPDDSQMLASRANGAAALPPVAEKLPEKASPAKAKKK